MIRVHDFSAFLLPEAPTHISEAKIGAAHLVAEEMGKKGIHQASTAKMVALDPMTDN